VESVAAIMAGSTTLILKFIPKKKTERKVNYIYVTGSSGSSIEAPGYWHISGDLVRTGSEGTDQNFAP
jgi:hypothetical protein